MNALSERRGLTRGGPVRAEVIAPRAFPLKSAGESYAPGVPATKPAP